MNLAILNGNLGSDPELRTSQSGLAILKLRIATKDRVKQGDTWQDRTEWHNVVVFGARADGLSRVLQKGSPLAVRGSMRTTSYDKDGVKMYKTEVIADDIELIAGGRGGGQRTPSGPGDSPGGAGQGGQPPGDFNDEDVPF